MLDVIPHWYSHTKYFKTNGKLDANNANAAISIKLAHKIFRMLLPAIFLDSPRKYPNDINPRNVPIIILVITALDPTQKDNWRKTTNSNDKLIYPFKNIKKTNHARNLRFITNPPLRGMLIKNKFAFKKI